MEAEASFSHRETTPEGAHSESVILLSIKAKKAGWV
jgi:hypothetical protein